MLTPEAAEDQPSFWDEACAQKELDDAAIKNIMYKRTIMLMGSQGVGKTELLNHFFDRTIHSRLRPTLALTHSSGRKASGSLKKNEASIWELGGGTTLLSTIDAIINTEASSSGMKGFTVVIMLDLSLPNKLWATLETILNHLRVTIKQQKSIEFPEFLETLHSEAWARVAEHVNADKEYLDPFPLPLVILCGKYDLFKKFDIDKKMVICNWLRYTAHTLGATLQFYSTNEIGLVKRAKELLLFHSFADHNYEPSVSLDHNGALLIPVGSDSIEKIRGRTIEQSGPAFFLSHFPQDAVLKLIVPDNPSIGFPHSAIDLLIAVKKEAKQEGDEKQQ